MPALVLKQGLDLDLGLGLGLGLGLDLEMLTEPEPMHVHRRRAEIHIHIHWSQLWFRWEHGVNTPGRARCGARKTRPRPSAAAAAF